MRAPVRLVACVLHSRVCSPFTINPGKCRLIIGARPRSEKRLRCRRSPDDLGPIYLPRSCPPGSPISSTRGLSNFPAIGSHDTATSSTTATDVCTEVRARDSATVGRLRNERGLPLVSSSRLSSPGHLFSFSPLLKWHRCEEGAATASSRLASFFTRPPIVPSVFECVREKERK
jgi:hypothetical protein